MSLRTIIVATCCVTAAVSGCAKKSEAELAEIERGKLREEKRQAAIKAYSDLILKIVGRDDSLVTYKDAEPFTTKTKPVDCSKAIRDLKHDPKITPEEGIRMTVDWMRREYNVAK